MLGQQNLAGLEKIQKQSKAVVDRWHEQLIKNEKKLLNDVFDRFEYKDDNPDMYVCCLLHI